MPAGAAPENPDAIEAVAAVEASGGGGEGPGEGWPDAALESAFLAEARARGETLPVRPTEADTADEVDNKALPSLNELVERIPGNVREVLEDLFRARFVSVKRVPKRALKT